MIFWKYKTPSHFNDLVLAWTAYFKYLYSFKELYHSTWVNKNLTFRLAITEFCYLRISSSKKFIVKVVNPLLRNVVKMVTPFYDIAK